MALGLREELMGGAVSNLLSTGESGRDCRGRENSAEVAPSPPTDVTICIKQATFQTLRNFT